MTLPSDEQLSAGARVRRDESRERLWPSRAEGDAGRSGFLEHVLMRLAAGELAYEDRWRGMDLDSLLGELTEETADIRARGVLARQALEDGAPVDYRIADRLHAAILWGAYALGELVRTRREVRVRRRA